MRNVGMLEKERKDRAGEAGGKGGRRLFMKGGVTVDSIFRPVTSLRRCSRTRQAGRQERRKKGRHDWRQWQLRKGKEVVRTYVCCMYMWQARWNSELGFVDVTLS